MHWDVFWTHAAVLAWTSVVALLPGLYTVSTERSIALIALHRVIKDLRADTANEESIMPLFRRTFFLC